MFKNKTIIVGISVLFVGYLMITLGVTGFLNLFNFTEKVSANPDYLCTKTVSTASCKVTSWSPRSGNERVGNGYKPIKVGYIHRRTTCAPGYTKEKRVGGSGGHSGRRSVTSNYKKKAGFTNKRYGSDYVMQYKNCQVIEQDTVNPEGMGVQK